MVVVVALLRLVVVVLEGLRLCLRQPTRGRQRNGCEWRSKANGHAHCAPNVCVCVLEQRSTTSLPK